MLYNIWIHFNGHTAKNAGLIAARPLREKSTYRINSEGKYETVEPKPLGASYQINITLEITGSNWTLDDKAFKELGKAYQLRFPNEKRPLAGKSYLKDCRESFRPVKGGK